MSRSYLWTAENLMIGDGSIDGSLGSLDRRPSGVTLQEFIPTAHPAVSEIPKMGVPVGGGVQEAQPPGPLEISVAKESGFVLPSLSDDGFNLDVEASGLGPIWTWKRQGPMLVDLDTIGQDLEIDTIGI